MCPSRAGCNESDWIHFPFVLYSSPSQQAIHSIFSLRLTQRNSSHSATFLICTIMPSGKSHCRYFKVIVLVRRPFCTQTALQNIPHPRTSFQSWSPKTAILVSSDMLSFTSICFLPASIFSSHRLKPHTISESSFGKFTICPTPKGDNN